MSAITLQSIETTVGHLLIASVHRAKALLHSISGVADTIVKDADAAAPFARSVLAVVAPQDAAALDATVAMLNAVDASLQSVDAAAQGGVTVQIPQAVLDAYRSAKTSVLSYENSL